MEVFVSWTGDDRDVKNVIVERLHNENIKCWDSDEYCTSDYSHECIKAIENCEVFIVIVSDASMKKGYVLNEVIKARNLENEGKLNILIYKTTSSPFTEQFEFQLNHISFVTGNLIQRKEQNTGEGNIDLLIKRTKALLKRRQEGDPEKPFSVNIPKVEGHEVTRTGYFVENSRKEALDSIHEALSRSNVVVLNELFGFGKRSTIRKYVECHRDAYTNVTMLSNPYGSLREFFLLGLNFTNLNSKYFDDYEGDKLVDKKIEQLAKLDEKTMLVIPDIKFEKQPDISLCEKLQTLKCRIVLITQESAEQYNDIFPVIRLGRMTNEHLLDLFYHHYPNVYDEEKEDLNPHLEKFFDEMGGHTKTIELTASVLAHELGVHPEDIPGYLSMNERGGMELKDRIMSQIASLYKIEQPGQEETIALVAASLMAVPYISEQRFKELLENFDIKDWQIIKGLADKKWIDIDFKNRTISIEPLIAQIVLKNNADNYRVFAKCVEYLYINDFEKLNILSCDSSILMNLLSRAEHILVSTNLDEMAAIPKYIKLYSINFDAESSELLRNAVSCFEERYPERYNEYYEEEQYVDEYEDECVDDVENISYGAFDDIVNDLAIGNNFYESEDVRLSDFYEDNDGEADNCSNDDEENNGYTKEELEYIASTCIRMLIPLAKLLSNKHYSWLANINGNQSVSDIKTFYKPQNNYVDMEEIFGISIDEVKGLLEAAKNENSFEEGSIEDRLGMELLVMYNDYMKRDFTSTMLHFNAVFELICQMGELDEDNQNVKLFFTLVCAMAKNHMKFSNTYHVAIKLCETALSIDTDIPEKMMVVQAYIEALRMSRTYEDTLYRCYDDYISYYDINIANHIEKREDALSEKKVLLLDYAVDLAMGGRFDEAKRRFSAAQKIGKAFSADMSVYSANKIMNAFINEGMFDEAIDFAAEHFDETTVNLLATSCSSDYLDDLQEICDIMHYSRKEEASDFETTDEYVDYYHDFSRENNSIAERKYYRIADKAMTYDFSDLFDEEISEYAAKLIKKAKTSKMHDIAPEAFALVSEAGMRVLGYRHHYVQYIGAAAMADGKIAEMLNGEGKTYTIPLVVFLNYLYGKKVIVTDSSRYLTERNYQWMKGVYDLLGIDNMLMSDFSVDLANSRGEQYGVVYAYLNDIVFNYLSNEIALSAKRKMPKLDCIIIDEIDSVLVDSATQPYIFTRYENDYQKLRQFDLAYKIAQSIGDDDRYCLYNNNSVVLKNEIIPLIEKNFNITYSDISNTNKIKKIEELICNAVLCCFYYEEDKDYFIDRNIPVYEDKRIGRFYKFSHDMTYFLCKKHDLSTDFLLDSLEKKGVPTNYICIRDFFRKFKTICGTTATAVSFRKEFMEIYGLDYVSIPPAHPIKRKDYLSPLFMNERVKRQAIIEKVIEKHGENQPVLMITEDIAESEYYSRALARRGVENIVLNAKNSDDCVDIIAQAGMLGSVMISTNIVNRGVDIVLGGNPELNTRKELVNMGVDVTGLDKMLYSLPDDKMLNSELYKKYRSIYEKNKAISAKNKEAVIAVGGLCVIGTSFFDEPRVEQQTRGRAGRQGEAGESWIFRSLDDSLLKQLLSENYISMIRSSVSSDATLDVKILDKSIKKARQKLHERKFDKIKRYNNTSKYIDDAREDFIGRRDNLQKGIISTDDILMIWAKNKDIGKLLARIQKGEKISDSKLLNRIYSNYPEQLKNLRGYSSDKVLFKVLKEELSCHLEKQGITDEKYLISIIESLIIYAWQSYVNIVYDTYNSVSMNEKLMERHFEEQKNELLLDMIEKLFNIQKRPVIRRDNKLRPNVSCDNKLQPNDPCPCGSGKKYKKCCGADKNSLS